MHRFLSLAILSFLVLALAPRAGHAQGLWIVDQAGGPGMDFTTVKAAVDHAADGDVIVIRPGIYGSAVVEAKALTLIGDGSGLVGVSGVYVDDLAPSQSVTLRGLAIQGYTQVLDCLGSVRIEDCTIRQMPGGFGGHGSVGVYRSDDVVFARCTTEVKTPEALGGALLYGLESTITIHESVLEGFQGAKAPKTFT